MQVHEIIQEIPEVPTRGKGSSRTDMAELLKEIELAFGVHLPGNHVYMHIHIHVHQHIYIFIYYTQIQICVCVCIQNKIKIYMHMYMYIHVYKYTYTYVYIYLFSDVIRRFVYGLWLCRSESWYSCTSCSHAREP